MDRDAPLTDGSPLQNELLERLLRCRPGDQEVRALASSVKQHCGYFRRDVRNLLRQRGLGDVEESDVKDHSFPEDMPDLAAVFADK
ncbi:MAG: hypothetical protein PHX87_02815 [Candidatus Peribacteraceae bacterium]|nr:hypothetical protein [Candidatus Peribacteraceae bacterium]MDD5742340.1 hypothetical protein [Candidatus Peribacteraceae bacterium]